MDTSVRLHHSENSKGGKLCRSTLQVKYEPCKTGARSSAVVLFALEGTLVVISLITWFADTLTDILVSFGYFENGDLRWGALTLVLVFLPSVIIQLFSARWYYSDGKMTGCYAWLVHIFLMQPLERYLFVLVAGWRAYKSQDPDDIESYYHQQNDVCMLRLFEAFLESAPQLTLQVYIMVATNSASWLTGVSACMSLLALGWSVTAYNHALRKAYRDDYFIFWPSLLLQTLWHIFMVSSRVASLVLFTCLYKGWVFLFLGIHWVIMTGWVIFQDTDFSPNLYEERLFNGVAGVIYCFCFFSLKEGATRWRMTFFYGMMLLESVILMGIWYPLKESKQWYDYALFTTVFAGFFFGLCCLLLYYRCCHPSGPIYCCQGSDQPSPRPLKVAYIQSPLQPSRNNSEEELKVNAFQRLTSASFFPRRSRPTLLKTQSKVMHVEYKEVATPSQLTPVKDRSLLRPSAPYDQTFEMADTPGFHHYSVNASECLELSSRCNTLQGTAIDLSCITPQLRNKLITPRNILDNDLIDQALLQLPNCYHKGKGDSFSPTNIEDYPDTIMLPSGYLGSPDDKAESKKQINKDDSGTPEGSPPLRSHYAFSCREMISTPQTNCNVPHLPLPDFTPIYPSVTPYLRVMGRNEPDWMDGSFTETKRSNQYPVYHSDEDTASLNVSQYDSFQTCKDDVSYYESCDELASPPAPVQHPVQTKHSQGQQQIPNSVPTTDTEYPTTDTEYITTDTEQVTTDTEQVTTDTENSSTTDTGYATSNS